MGTHTFELLFLNPKPGDLAGPPLSHIYIKNSSRNQYRGVSEDLVLIGSECFSIREVEHEVERLKRELDDIKKIARKKYARAKP